MGAIDVLYGMPPGLRGALISIYDGELRRGDGDLSVQLLARKYPELVKISGGYAKVTAKGRVALRTYLQGREY